VEPGLENAHADARPGSNIRASVMIGVSGSAPTTNHPGAAERGRI